MLKRSVAIVSEGDRSLGKVENANASEDREIKTESRMKARLAVSFGGRNAERLIFGEHTPGCLGDTENAKGLAAYMINHIAVGEFGVTTELDLLREADRTATVILTEHREQVLMLAKTLCKNNSVNDNELEELL